METIVIRGAGDKEGPAIVDRLLTTSEARRERGRIEIDKNCSSRVIRDIQTLYPHWIAPGTFVIIEDAELGDVPGILLGISARMGPGDFIQRILRVEVEAK